MFVQPTGLVAVAGFEAPCRNEEEQPCQSHAGVVRHTFRLREPRSARKAPSSNKGVATHAADDSPSSPSHSLPPVSHSSQPLSNPSSTSLGAFPASSSSSSSSQFSSSSNTTCKDKKSSKLVRSLISVVCVLAVFLVVAIIAIIYLALRLRRAEGNSGKAVQDGDDRSPLVGVESKEYHEFSS